MTIHAADSPTRTGAGVSKPSFRAGQTDRIQVFALCGLLGAVAILYLLTLRSGHPWGDDFALYVLHARNLATGLPYEDTGFIYNPSVALYSPAVYPPGFPLLLAPVYALFGFDLVAMRLVVIISAVAAFAAFAYLIRPFLSTRLVLVAAALVGFQPFFIRFKNLLLPDFTFLLFVLLSLLLLRRIDDRRTSDARALTHAVVAGACIYFALSLRIAGVALFGAVALYQLVQRRLPSRAVVLCLAVAMLLYGIQSTLMPPASGYLAQMSDLAATTGSVTTPDRINPLSGLFGVAHRYRDLFAATDVLWSSTGDLRAPPTAGLHRGLVLSLMVSTTLLAAVGFLSRLRSMSMVETFVIAYVGLLGMRGNGARYLLPLMPFLIYYAVLGWSYLNHGQKLMRRSALALATIVIFVYGVNLLRTNRRPYVAGVTSESATELFDYIRACTPERSRFSATKPRALALMTGREATISGMRRDGFDEYFRFNRSNGVHYILVSSGSHLDETLAAHADFSLKFRNRNYGVYRDVRQPLPPDTSTRPHRCADGAT